MLVPKRGKNTYWNFENLSDSETMSLLYATAVLLSAAKVLVCQLLKPPSRASLYLASSAFYS
jgi:hypothetical protein